MLIQIPTQPFTSSVTLARPRALARFLYLSGGTLAPAFERVPRS